MVLLESKCRYSVSGITVNVTFIRYTCELIILGYIVDGYMRSINTVIFL